MRRGSGKKGEENKALISCSGGKGTNVAEERSGAGPCGPKGKDSAGRSPVTGEETLQHRSKGLGTKARAHLMRGDARRKAKKKPSRSYLEGGNYHANLLQEK